MQLYLHCLECARIARKDKFFHFANSLEQMAASFHPTLLIRPDNGKEVLAQLNAKRTLKEIY